MLLLLMLMPMPDPHELTVTTLSLGCRRFVLNSITGTEDPDAKQLDLYSCTCLLGYALLPLVGHAMLALLLPRCVLLPGGRPFAVGLVLPCCCCCCHCVLLCNQCMLLTRAPADPPICLTPPTPPPCLLARRRSLPSMAAAALAVLWAGQTASRLFCRRSPLLDGQQSCVLYPCLLMYSSFALLSLY